MKTKPQILIGVIAAIALAWSFLPATGEDFAEQLRTPIDQSIDTRIRTQENLDQWHQERARLVAGYESLQEEQAALSQRLSRLQSSVAGKQTIIDSLESRIKEAETMAEAVQPFLETIYSRLVELVETDLPFLSVERQERLGHLKELLENPETALSEKFRKTMETLFIEASYGNTTEVYQEQIRLEDSARLFSVFRLGRIALLCLSPDQELAGYYNVAEEKWEMLPGHWRRELRAAIDMAEKRRPADLVCLPLGRLSGQSAAIMWKSPYFFLLLFLLQLPAFAQDMRADHVKARQKKESALRQAHEAARQAEREAEQSRQAILTDKNALYQAIAELEKKNERLQQQIVTSEKRLERLAAEELRLQSAYADVSGVVKEIIGFTRSNARDLITLFAQSPQSALTGDRSEPVRELAEAKRFPGMKDIRLIVDLLTEEIRLSGQVRTVSGTVIDRNGRQSSAEILLAGNLTTAYRTASETGYALYSDTSNSLFALSGKPPFMAARQIEKYMAGKSDGLYLDLSGGAALRQLTHKLNLVSQIPRGGPIVWPILLIFILGAGITAERFRYLQKRDCDAETFMTGVTACVRQEDWSGCRNLCESEKGKSVPKVIRTALDFKEMSREDMENALQEAILNEVPRLERFLSTLGMLAAIAPLLGLLGTVTGMINTFHMITYYGTGDPRMMSGGISEALVTTMLGLCVAIPLMLAHTLLNRRVENIISQMEEKAVSFVNQVFKERGRGVAGSRGQGVE